MPKVINTITKAADSDNYPVARDLDLLGSFRIVNNITERDAIGSNLRKERMIVYVVSTGHYYDLRGGISNGDWNDIGTELGGGAGSISNFVNNEVHNLIQPTYDVELNYDLVSGTQKAYFRGIRCSPGVDYTVSGKTLVFNDQLLSGDVVLIDYIKP